ncbi:GumC family protein [Terriglobus sp.]|uniref:GumC family protein n=1 Tax=Terriglobus sp. TaxID=1889013 RepID=UPI003AFFBD15
MLGHRSLVLDDYVGILKRRGWIILIPLILLPILTVAFSYTIPPEYLSQTLVLVEAQRVAEGIVKPILSTDLDSRLSSMKEQILSRSSIQPIIDRYNLYGDRKISMDDRIDIARKNIDIKTITSETGHGGLPGFFISFKSGDPHTAQQVCTEITSLFTNANLRSRSDAAEGTVSFLKSQLDDAKRNLDEQDAKLAAFQQQNFGKLPGEEASNSNMLASLNTQLEASTQALARMQQDKSFAESLLASQLGAANAANAAASAAANAVGTGNTAAIPADNPAVVELQRLQAVRAQLLTQYTPSHPDVLAIDRAIADQRRQVARNAAPRVAGTGGPAQAAAVHVETPAIQQLRAQIQSAELGIAAKRAEQSQIQGQIGSYQSKLMSSPAIAAQYKQLTRDNQTAQTFYDDLRTKINGAQMATDLENRQQGEQFRLMDAANLPEAPFSPKRSVFLVAGLAGGLVLGLAVVLLLEFRDTSMRTERDVWAFLDLPVLTSISLSDQVPSDGPTGRSWLTRIFLQRVKRSDLAGSAKAEPAKA